MLVTAARIVDRLPGRPEPVDLRLRDAQVVAIGDLAPEPGEQVVPAEGRWLIPGLWDAHVHFEQWATSRQRLDLGATRSAAEVLAVVAGAQSVGEPTGLLVGFGYRLSYWPDGPDAGTLAALDAVTGSRPTVLISGDAHNGWLNSAAAGLLGIEPPPGPLLEHAWFAQMSRVLELERANPNHARFVDEAIADALGRGIVGLVDLDFNRAWQGWLTRSERGQLLPRIRAGVYPEYLDEVIQRGWRSGQRLAPLVEMGPLKIISDGALGTLTAHCRVGYLGPDGQPGANRGVQSVPPAQLAELLERATRHGLAVAVHAIGDAALEIALDAFEATRAAGSIEHAQLADPKQIARLARLGVAASVQPAHLPDDVAVMGRVWADRTENTFPLRTMLDAGVELRLGSDAPISALDPWLQLDAAVRRPDGWHPEQALSRGEALFASTAGQPPVGPGSRADLVLLDADPHHAELAGMRAATTIIDGQLIEV